MVADSGELALATAQMGLELRRRARNVWPGPLIWSPGCPCPVRVCPTSSTRCGSVWPRSMALVLRALELHAAAASRTAPRWVWSWTSGSRTAGVSVLRMGGEEPAALRALGPGQSCGRAVKLGARRRIGVGGGGLLIMEAGCGGKRFAIRSCWGKMGHQSHPTQPPGCHRRRLAPSQQDSQYGLAVLWGLGIEVVDLVRSLTQGGGA